MIKRLWNNYNYAVIVLVIAVLTELIVIKQL
jgi:hypothetical protein